MKIQMPSANDMIDPGSLRFVRVVSKAVADEMMIDQDKARDIVGNILTSDPELGFDVNRFMDIYSTTATFLASDTETAKKMDQFDVIAAELGVMLIQGLRVMGFGRSDGDIFSQLADLGFDFSDMEEDSSYDLDRINAYKPLSAKEYTERIDAIKDEHFKRCGSIVMDKLVEQIANPNYLEFIKNAFDPNHPVYDAWIEMTHANADIAENDSMKDMMLDFGVTIMMCAFIKAIDEGIGLEDMFIGLTMNPNVASSATANMMTERWDKVDLMSEANQHLVSLMRNKVDHRVIVHHAGLLARIVCDANPVFPHNPNLYSTFDKFFKLAVEIGL